MIQKKYSIFWALLLLFLIPVSQGQVSFHALQVYENNFCKSPNQVTKILYKMSKQLSPLDRIMLNLVKTYEEEIDIDSGFLETLSKVVMIIIIVFMIGVLVVAFVFPIIKMNKL